MNVHLRQRFMGFLLLLLMMAIVLPVFLKKTDDSGVTLSLDIPDPPQVQGLQAIQPVTDMERERVLESIASDRAQSDGGSTGNTEDMRRPEGLQSWAVQVDSTADVAKAESLMKRLHAAGFRSFQRLQTGTGGRIVQVFVGPELQQSQAQKTVRRLADELGIAGELVLVDRRLMSEQ